MPGGCSLCFTPNRLNGLHCISRYSGDHATGFHLKEYTLTALIRVFRSVGFGRIPARLALKGRWLDAPLLAVTCLEAPLGLLSRSWQQRLGGLPGFRHVLLAAIVSWKRRHQQPAPVLRWREALPLPVLAVVLIVTPCSYTCSTGPSKERFYGYAPTGDDFRRGTAAAPSGERASLL